MDITLILVHVANSMAMKFGYDGGRKNGNKISRECNRALT